MASNTREYLIVARLEIERALIEEGEGTGASEQIVDRIARAQENLNRAVGVQRAILTHRKDSQ